MKKCILNIRLFALAFITMITASAASATDSSIVRPELSAELKYEGLFRNNPVFQLTIPDIPVHDEYIIRIRDSWDNVLYTEKVNAGQFSKKFLFNYEELGEQSLYISISSRKQRRETVYEINRSTRSLEEYSVNTLK